MMFFKNRAQKGREYSHWIDLTLGIHFEAVISKSCRTEIRFMSTPTCFDQKSFPKRHKKIQRPQNRFVGSDNKTFKKRSGPT